MWKSEEEGIDVEYLVGQVIVGKEQVDYKSNCGNMTSAVGPFAIEEGLVPAVEPITTVHMLNKNTNKYIDVTVPCENGTFAQEGDCHIAGVDGTAAELRVKFLNPAGSKTGNSCLQATLRTCWIFPEWEPSRPPFWMSPILWCW